MNTPQDLRPEMAQMLHRRVSILTTLGARWCAAGEAAIWGLCAVAAVTTLVLLATQSSHASAPPRNIEATAHAIESELIAPCCFKHTLATHSSPKAEEMKREIRTFLQQGWSVEQVQDHYLETYGERILAAPRPAGFNLLAYLMPAIFVLVGAIVCGLWVWRHRAPEEASPTPQGEALAANPELVSKVDAELARFE